MTCLQNWLQQHPVPDFFHVLSPFLDTIQITRLMCQAYILTLSKNCHRIMHPKQLSRDEISQIFYKINIWFFCGEGERGRRMIAFKWQQKCEACVSFFIHQTPKFSEKSLQIKNISLTIRYSIRDWKQKSKLESWNQTKKSSEIWQNKNFRFLRCCTCPYFFCQKRKLSKIC